MGTTPKHRKPAMYGDCFVSPGGRRVLKGSCLGLALALLLPTKAAHAFNFESVKRLTRTAVSRTFYRGRVRKIQQALDRLAALPKAKVQDSLAGQSEPLAVIRKAVEDVEAGLAQARAKPWAWQAIEHEGEGRPEQSPFSLLLRRVAKPAPVLRARTSGAIREELLTELAIRVRDGQWKVHAIYRGGDGAYRTVYQWHTRVEDSGPSILTHIKDQRDPSIYRSQMTPGETEHWRFVTATSVTATSPLRPPEVLEDGPYRSLLAKAERALRASDAVKERDEDP